MGVVVGFTFRQHNIQDSSDVTQFVMAWLDTSRIVLCVTTVDVSLDAFKVAASREQQRINTAISFYKLVCRMENTPRKTQYAL